MAMISEQVLNALAHAEARLIGLGYDIQEYPNKERKLPFLGKPEAGCHLLYMIQECRQMLNDGRREKVMRWLGFIQGTLWAMGEYSIDELKDTNKPQS